jgi:hypothetical protein
LYGGFMCPVLHSISRIQSKMGQLYRTTISIIGVN